MSHNSKEIPGYHFYLGSGYPLPIPSQPADIFSLISLMTDKFKHSVWNSMPTITLFQTWMSLGEILHHSWQWIAQNDCHSRWKGTGLMTLWHFRKYAKKGRLELWKSRDQKLTKQYSSFKNSNIKDPIQSHGSPQSIVVTTGSWYDQQMRPRRVPSWASSIFIASLSDATVLMPRSGVPHCK